MNVKIKRLHEAAVIPQYAHDYDAGVDLVATEDIIVEPGQTVKVPTGIAIQLPPGYEAAVRPRSGITLKTKLRVQLGTIDSGYIGEISVIVDNTEEIKKPGFLEILRAKLAKKRGEFNYNGEIYPEGTFVIEKYTRIAQLVIAPVEQATFIEVDTLEETQRGSGGFGSSGVKA